MEPLKNNYFCKIEDNNKVQMYTKFQIFISSRSWDKKYWPVLYERPTIVHYASILCPILIICKYFGKIYDNKFEFQKKLSRLVLTLFKTVESWTLIELNVGGNFNYLYLLNYTMQFSEINAIRCWYDKNLVHLYWLHAKCFSCEIEHFLHFLINKTSRKICCF